MAVSATFAADFSSFQSAIEKSVVKLKDLSSTSGRVEKDLSRMTNAYSGTDLIRQATLSAEAIERIGGKSKLTQKELERAGSLAQEAAAKLRAMGETVPAKIQAIADAVKPIPQHLSLAGKAAEFAKSRFGQMFGAFTAASLVDRAVSSFADMIKSTGEFAGQMVDLNAQWQIGTTRLQAFNYAGAGVGLSIDNLTGSADQLQKRIGGNDASVVGALSKLNLNIDDLKNQSLDQVLFKIDQALVGVGNQFERTRILTELFGKSGAQMSRLFTGDLQKIIEETERSGAVIDEELIKKADAFDDAWSQGWIKFRAYAVNSIGFVGGLLEELRLRGFRFPESTPPPVSGLKPVDFTKFKIVGGQVVPKDQLGDGIVQGAGMPEVDAGLARAREQMERLTLAVLELDSEARNAQGMHTFTNDVAFFTSTTSKATEALQKLVMQAKQIGQLSGNLQAKFFDPALLMGGIGEMPFGGNLFGKGGKLSMGDSSFFGGLKGGLNDLLKGMTGGGGVGGFLSNLGGGIVKGFGDILSGGISSAISAGIGLLGKGVGKLFGGMFGGEGKKANDLRDKLFGDLGGFDEVAKKAAEIGFSMDRLLKPGKVKDVENAWKDFNRTLDAHNQKLKDQQSLIDATAQRQQMLQDALSRYNFTATEKGPLVNQTEMAKQAELLLNDWKLLVGSSVDVNAVIREMSGSMSEFVTRAIKTGTEIPEAMRDMIVKMIEQGQLLDENGTAFTSLEQTGIKFGETLSSMFENLLTKLDELIDKLSNAQGAFGDLSKTASNMPTSGPVWQVPDTGYEQYPGFASGTKGKYLSFGAGTPVMLHGKEKVVTEAEGRAEAASQGAVIAAIDRLSARLSQQQAMIPILARDAALKAMA
jgi:hypothetical protein